MKKIIYTNEDGSVSIVIPAPKADIEKVLGPLDEEAYKNFVIQKSIPQTASNVREIDEEDIPPTREFRQAWCDVSEASHIDIDCQKAKDIVLCKLRTERQALFEELGFPTKLNSELEGAIIGKETRDKLKVLREATEPLKQLDCEGVINDDTVLEKIKKLGVLPCL